MDAVVVAYRSQDHIGACLDALASVEGLQNIVVIDHGDGETARRAALHGATVVHDPTNPGFGRGQNRGVAMGRAPYLLMVNPDAVVRKAAVACGVALLDERPRVAAVQGTIANSETAALERSHGRELGPVHLLGRAFALRRLLRFRTVRRLARLVPAVSDHVERAPAGVVETEWLAATALLVRRSAFESVGGFSDAYFLYGEDLDLCHRLRLAGWTLLATPEEWATHQSGASAATDVDREITWWNGSMTFAALWWRPSAWSMALAASAVAGLRLVLRSPSHARGVASKMIAAPWRHRRGRAALAEPPRTLA